MFPQLYIGWSALRVSSAGLDVVGQNVANAANPNYHRQTLHQSTLPPVLRDGQWFGSGVDIHSISRSRNHVLALAIAENRSLQSRYNSHLSAKRHVESLLTPSEGGITGRIQSLFEQMDALSARPDDAVGRRQFVHTAQNLAGELNRVAASVNTLRLDLDTQIRVAVREVNQLSQQIVSINQQVAIAQAQGGNPNPLLDQRDALVQQLSELVDVDVNERENFILAAGGGIVVGPSGGQEIGFHSDGAGTATLLRVGDQSPLPHVGGTLGGLIDAYNGLQAYDAQLDDLAASLIRGIDQQHATGVGLDGSFSVLTSARRVSNVVDPLANANLPIDLAAGELTITVTDSASGEKSLHTISWDPATDSLTDIAGQLSSVPHLQATVNASAGQLAIFAQPGHLFDFTGGIATRPTDMSGFNGTTQPMFAGIYTGNANETFTFEVSGPGEIGVTPGLTVLVRNSAGEVVKSLDVGQGYSPDSELEVIDGIKVSFSLGTMQAGDTFTAQAVRDSDTSGLLSALAINTLFVGQSAADLAVHGDLLSDPRRLATSLSGNPSDASNLLRMIDARQSLVADNGTATIEQFTAQLISDVGDDVRQLSLEHEHAAMIGERLNAEREAVSGVNPDEELVLMLQYQRSFEAAARFVAVIRETTSELLSLIN